LQCLPPVLFYLNRRLKPAVFLWDGKPDLPHRVGPDHQPEALVQFAAGREVMWPAL
jgi:hypothetical protein